MSKKEQLEQEKLRLMVFKSAMELGEKIDKHLLFITQKTSIKRLT